MVADHSSVVAHPYLLMYVNHSYLDLSVFPGLTRRAHLVELEGERGQSGGGAAEERL